ncbi:MAG: translational GTPase TypA, partial [Clostridiaceae bacterium]|nr:translational GTPase TypA [Clostridiaceae bacterium]
QTRFVLRKALSMNLKPIVVINKIDRKDARAEEVIDEILDLFIELGADEDLLEFPIIYASARDGYATLSLNESSDNLEPLFECILNNVPAPEGDDEEPLQLLVSSLDYDDYIGRIAIGRVERGTIKKDQQAVICKSDGATQEVKLSSLQYFQGLKRTDITSASVGEIVAVSGITDITIGDTICDKTFPEPLPFVKIDEPTISMYFMVNNSPFAGKEGTYVTSRHLRDRLFKEVETNVSMRVEETDSPDSYKVSGRGELHLAILIETMRREGYEFQVSKPEVITITDENGKVLEPIEYLVIDVPEEYVGNVIEKLGMRKAEMVNMYNASQGFVRIDFKIPARCLIGYRSEFLTDTRGNGIMNHVFYGYEPHKGDIKRRSRGVLVAWEDGESVTYGLYNAQDRGSLFIGPGVSVYEGMIVGECSRNEDIVINVCKKKHVTNMRAAGSDEALKLIPHVTLSLEQCLEFIEDDELVEITPKSIRLRKKILNTEQRAKVRSGAKK